MADEKIFTEGMFCNAPHENAPDFVKCKIGISVDNFIEWLQAQPRSEKGYVSIDVKASQGGKWYSELDTYVPKQKNEDVAEGMGQDIPF